MYNLVNQKFGKLTVVEKTAVRKGKGHVVWRCICDCGNQNYFIITDHLMRKSAPVRSCGCQSKSREYSFAVSEKLAKRSGVGANNANWRGCGEIPLGAYTSLVKRVSENPRQSRTIDITIEYLNELFLKQEKRCALSGEPLRFVPRYAANASLDRIDSSLGYISGNVQWVHKDINIMKNVLSQKMFILICNKVSAIHPVDINVQVESSTFGKNK
jgi:hypothetical protein